MSPSGIDDNTLADLINQIPEKALLLMEDIDAAFVDPGVNRDDQQNKTGTGIGHVLVLCIICRVF